MNDQLTYPGQTITVTLETTPPTVLNFRVLKSFDFAAEKEASQHRNGVFTDQEFQVEGFMIELERRGLIERISTH